jgi:hypothetical protein
METAAIALSSAATEAFDSFMANQPEECLEIWKSLPAPPFGEMNGEYAGHYLPNYNDVYKQFVAAGLDNINSPTGLWLGKAYMPLGQASGEGYNVWKRPDGTVERRIRYTTHIGTSRVDGRLALVMNYASFNRTVGALSASPAWEGDTIDEVRKLADGIYVGVGTLSLAAMTDPFRKPMADIYRSYGFDVPADPDPTARTPAVAGMFVLTGPISAAQGVDDAAAEDQ